jgi:hypothetical protein
VVQQQDEAYVGEATPSDKEGKNKVIYLDKAREIDINDAHEFYAHLNFVLQPLLRDQGFIVYVNGKNKKKCEACAYGKAKLNASPSTPPLLRYSIYA